MGSKIVKVCVIIIHSTRESSPYGNTLYSTLIAFRGRHGERKRKAGRFRGLEGEQQGFTTTVDEGIMPLYLHSSSLSPSLAGPGGERKGEWVR